MIGAQPPAGSLGEPTAPFSHQAVTAHQVWGKTELKGEDAPRDRPAAIQLNAVVSSNLLSVGRLCEHAQDMSWPRSDITLRFHGSGAVFVFEE